MATAQHDVSTEPDAKPLKPQSGPQELFLKSVADIAIYGGAAGAGKTYAELLEPLYHINNPAFTGITFRREATQITNPGGLWDAAMKLYPRVGGRPVQSPQMRFNFPSGAYVQFSHLNHEASVLNYQGAEVPLIQFDELTHFTQSQFFYMLSRNRSTSGITPYMRATTNPDADSWVARLIAWWIDQKTGLFIPERSGVLRWFIRIDDAILWEDTREALFAKYRIKHLALDDDEQIRPLSLTFIGATIFDNRELMRTNPQYLANLRALPAVERERLLGGNWRVRKSSGMYFKREWLSFIDARPNDPTIEWVRHWDLAATLEEEGTDPDWTVGILMGRQREGNSADGKPYYRFIIADRIKFRGRPGDVEKELLRTAKHDGPRVRISLPQDPGQAGKAQAQRFIAMLAGYNVQTAPESGDKVTRFGPFSAQAEGGNVYVVRFALGSDVNWIEDWCLQLEGFPEAIHDDDADATSGAFNRLLMAPPMQIVGQVVMASSRFGMAPP